MFRPESEKNDGTLVGGNGKYPWEDIVDIILRKIFAVVYFIIILYNYHYLPLILLFQNGIFNLHQCFIRQSLDLNYHY